MTARQLCQNLANLFPNHYVRVNSILTRYSCKSNNRTIVESYSLCMQPGFDGTDCQQWSGDTVDDIAEKFSEMVSELILPGKVVEDIAIKEMPKGHWAINIYDPSWKLVETYVLVDTRKKAEDIASRDSVQLSNRSQQGLHIRIDELDSDGNYVPGTVGYAQQVQGTKVPTVTA